MDKVLSSYLDQVDRRLRPLPAAERADIVQEIRSEMLELEAGGLTPEQICGRLGDPKGLAAAYLGDVIAKNPGFSWSRLGAVAAFYSISGAVGMFVLPFTSVLAAGLMFSGIISPLAGILKYAAALAGFDLPFVMFQIGTYTPSPAKALLLSVITGILLFWAGRVLWRLTVRLVQKIGQHYRDLQTRAL